MKEEEIINFEEKLKVPVRLKCLYLLQGFDKKKEYCYSDLERGLGFNKPRWDIRQLFDFMVEKKLLIFLIKRLGVNFYKIDTKSIGKYLSEHESFKLAEHKIYVESIKIGKLSLADY